MKRLALLSLIVALTLLVIPHPAWAAPPPPKVGSATYTLAPPKADATTDKPIILSLTAPDPANPGQTITKQIQVPFLGPPPQPTLAAFDPTKETAAQASQRKRDAIAAAVNAYIAAGLLPAGVTVTTDTGPSWQWTPTPSRFDPQGRFCCWVFVPKGGANGYGTITIGGLTGRPKTVKDPTKEYGTGANWTPGNGPLPAKPSYTPSMSGSGSSMGSSTGVDPTGAQSVVAFGFYVPDSLTNCTPVLPTDCPGVDIATISPVIGETDAQILGDLALQFNSLFGPEGHTATYNLLTDTLRLDQPLNSDQTFFWANADTGLDFSTELAPVPEPSMGVLVAITGLIGMSGMLWRRHRRS
jgi:hypothetical protein